MSNSDTRTAHCICEIPMIIGNKFLMDVKIRILNYQFPIIIIIENSQTQLAVTVYEKS